MKDSGPLAPNTRTWREIPQPVRPRAMSREGRKRFVLAGLKTTGLVVATVAAGWGILEVAGIWQTEPKRIARAVGTAAVSRVDLQTDGMLDQAWVERTLALPRSITLMELDLARLQSRLLAHGQVRSVVLTKVPPATLRVTIAERPPVARLRPESGPDFLVARDGVVFPGIGHDTAMIESLPWLAGVNLARAGDGFAPIKGMETVADLLATARNEAPLLYQKWSVVNLARLENDGEIEVRSEGIEKIIFSTALDFNTQVARLDYVADLHPMPLQSVNLGLGSQVVVAHGEAGLPARPPVGVPAGRTPGPGPRFDLRAFPNLQSSRPTNRDL